MERARSTVTNFFGRVPLAYTRFSLTPQTDGDASQVEMKLADEEECGDSTMEDHVVKQRAGSNGCKSLCFKILAATLLFFIGFIIGYLTHRGRISSTPDSNNGAIVQTYNVEETTDLTGDEEKPAYLYWSDLKPKLDKNVDFIDFESSIKKLCGMSREAGSANEGSLAAMMHSEFTSMKLDKVWDDEHYVTLQQMDGSNKIQVLKSGQVEQTYNPTSYVAYSLADSVTGSLVYCYYGQADDFNALRVKNIDVTGKLVLVRSGRIGFAEKVRNAEIAKAIGVLIYPEPSDFTFPSNDLEEIESPFGHVHFGTGDPYTPGFPSFNHTQFPPSESSGLPKIPVQTLSSSDGKALLGLLDRDGCPDWQDGCKLPTPYKIKLDVNNVLAEKKILNVFGAIRGFEEPDRYVVVGAQRDSWDMGVAKAVVGSSVLLELARAIMAMVKDDGYKPRRTIVFASWSAGDFGAVGATEWLEGYLTNLHLKTISYISLDAAVQGAGSLDVSASPLMYAMMQKTLKEVGDPVSMNDKKLSNQAQAKDFIKALSLKDPAYPFLAFSGVPSVSFNFMKDKKPYAYLGTKKDTFESFQKLVPVNSMCRAVAKIAAQIVLRLTHDHTLPLDFIKYKEELGKVTIDLNRERQTVNRLNLTLQWINSASGDFSRAAIELKNMIDQSDLENKPFLRTLNDRVMKVEHSMLSPYTSPGLTPFRHIFYGYGGHTFSELMKNLQMLKEDESSVNKDYIKNQLALLTWTIQGAANALTGEIWEINNEF